MPRVNKVKSNVQADEFSLEELIHPQTVLARIYHDKLPQKRWAGVKSRTEKEYIKYAKAQRREGNPD